MIIVQITTITNTTTTKACITKKTNNNNEHQSTLNKFIKQTKKLWIRECNS